MEQYKSYTLKILALLALILVFVPTFNFLVDPEKIFDFLAVPGFNLEKPHKSGDRRFIAAELMRHQYPVIILGTSTARRIDPNHPGFGEKPGYRINILGANYYEIYQIFEFICKHQKVSKLVLPLDFHSFLKDKKTTADFADSAFSGEKLWLLNFKYLFSLNTFLSSLKTIQLNQRLGNKVPTPFGTILPEEPKEPTDHRWAFRQGFFERHPVYPEKDIDFAYGPDRVELLKKMLFRCRALGIQTYLYISPVHAWQLSTYKRLGIWDDYQRWKRDLVRAVAEVNHSGPDLPPLELWDFSGYNSVTTEELPEPGDKTRQMKYWYDPVHFPNITGYFILDRILHFQDPSRNLPADFGVILTPENIESYLWELQAGQEQYEQSHPQEIKNLEALYLATKRLFGSARPLSKN